MNMHSSRIYLPILIGIVVSIAGCDAKQKTASKDNAVVVAEVNGAKLTEAQVQSALERIPNLDKSRTKEASLQIARSLVEQELLVQKAEQEKLTDDPKVKEMLEATRKQVLAQAYMEKKLGPPVLPTDGEISAYYNQHPELFSQRKLYRLQEVAIKAPPSEHEAIRTQLAAAKSLNEFAAWLKTKNYPINATQEIKAAEQLPPPLLAKLQALPVGQATVVTVPDGLIILVLAGSQLQPVTEAQAKPAIERVVQAQKRQEAAKQELEKLKAAAKIEYKGDYAEAGKLNSTPAPNATSSEPGKATEQSSATPATK